METSLVAGDDSTMERVLFSALFGAVRIAANRLVPLKRLKQLVELAYYREARRRRLKMREMRELLDVSMSKVGLLSKDLKAHFSEPYREHELPRRILNLLWAGPLSQHGIATALEDAEPADVGAALRVLLETGEVVEEPGRAVARYRVTRQAFRRRGPDDWMAHVAALNDLWRAVSLAAEARLLEQDERAMARTLHFRVRPEDVAALHAAYEKHLFPLVCELDARVQADEVSVPVALSYVVAPEPEENEAGEDET